MEKSDELSISDEPGGRGNCIAAAKNNTVTNISNSINNADELASFIHLSKDKKNIISRVCDKYHMRITPYYFSLIKDPNDEKDPILKQCIPSIREIDKHAQEQLDPLGEEKDMVASCLVHRYPDRVLLLVTGKCFMYCRHCTRKRLWREKECEPTLNDIDKALLYVKDNRQIREVVISGGDPLTLPTERLDYILAAVSKIPHIEVMRIGTRAPVVLPSRVDKHLCNVLGKYSNLWINLQFNHPDEVTFQSSAACRRLQAKGIVLSNQSVLLKGVNDDPKVMISLCHKLQAIRVRPYYLYQCDPVVGASHFRTSVACGVDIINKMRGFTSGMCIPTFVVDGIDGRGKVPLGPQYFIESKDDGVKLRNYCGEEFFYSSPEKEHDTHAKLNRKDTTHNRYRF